MRTCALVTVFAFLAQVECGYEYQVSGANWMSEDAPQLNEPLATVSQSYEYAQNSIPISEYRDHNIRQYQQSSYQNFIINNNNNELPSQVQSGSDLQNVQQIFQTQPVQPVVTKHIYFHVPPPDENIRPVQPSLVAKRKKYYNIIFIKLPSTKVQNNSYASTETATLIYLLVKSPEDQPKALPEQSKPNHEVFYVKYKGTAKNPTAVNNGVFSQQNFDRNLRPGLVNGQ